MFKVFLIAKWQKIELLSFKPFQISRGAQITTIPFQCLPRRLRHVFRHFCYNYVLFYVKFHRILAKKCTPTSELYAISNTG